jgi:hypothetical protein
MRLQMVISIGKNLRKKIKEVVTRKEQIDKDIDYLKHVCS